MQDYSDVLELLNKDLDARSQDVRDAMNVVNEIKTLISQIQTLQNRLDVNTAPQSDQGVSQTPNTLV